MKPALRELVLCALHTEFCILRSPVHPFVQIRGRTRRTNTGGLRFFSPPVEIRIQPSTRTVTEVYWRPNQVNMSVAQPFVRRIVFAVACLALGGGCATHPRPAPPPLLGAGAV